MSVRDSRTPPRLNGDRHVDEEERAERERVEEEAREEVVRPEPGADDPLPEKPQVPTIQDPARESVARRPDMHALAHGTATDGDPVRPELERSGALESPGPRRLGRGSARDRRRHFTGRVFAVVCGAATLVGIVALAVLLFDVLRDGLPVLDGEFLTNFASRFPERAGVKAALWGSVWILALTAAISFPLGVGAALYLEEYAPKNWVTRTIQTNIANLAGVPSIVYGILGLALFVRLFALDRSVISGALTLSLLILPVVIMASQEAIRAVPDSIRQAAYGLGATRWQTVRTQVLPMALPGILTGTILALSRAVGETAPLIMVGAAGFLAFTPDGLLDQFTVLPLQIYSWVSRPQPEFQALAAAAIIVLLVILLSMNAVAILLRNRYQKRQ